MRSEFSLETKRLFLVPLPPEALMLCRNGRHMMERSLGLEVTRLDRDPPEIQKALEEMIGRTLESPSEWKWNTNWEIVSKALNRIIGGCAFYGPPDGGAVCEIAYVIQEPFRGKGYAAEAVDALCEWAFANGAKTVRAEVETDNLPSANMLKKISFSPTGSPGEGVTVYERSRRN